jgi:hypothetical protein
MTDLPNPFESGAIACAPEEAAAVPSPRSPTAAADIQELLEAIGGDCRFVLDEESFMAAIEPPPLFLQRTG